MDLKEIGGVLQSVGDVLPFAHAIDASRAVMNEGAGFGDIASDVVWVAGYTLAVMVLAVVVFRRRMRE
jgi:ABC-2 type transport system permease protein